MANEKRLIFDVDMKSAFRAWLDNEDFRTINEMIDDVPTADAVEVVRCKDCHNFTKSKWCNLLMMDVKDGWYCSHGERRTDDKRTG